MSESSGRAAPPIRARRKTRLPSVVLVGRPNVGKSTLFNRVTGIRRSIVTSTPGTTRDVIAHPASWGETWFQIVDTGGMFGASDDPLHKLVFERGQGALEEADLIIFIVDGREGLVSGDAEIANAARGADVPVILAVNKMDDRRARNSGLEFYQFGFDPVIEIAAEHGLGVADLLDEVVKRLPSVKRPPQTEDRAQVSPETRVAIVGRPNVGKSSLVNRLLREDRVMVSELPGTTRDAVDAVMTWHKREFRIVDTAGIRRPGRVSKSGQLEAVSVIMAKRAIEQANVVVVLVDSTEGATDQEAAIAGVAERAGCGVIIAANKWDLVKSREPNAARDFDARLRRQLKFLDFAPVVHISARTGERTSNLITLIDQVSEARRKRVSTGELNRFVDAVTAVHPPVSPGKREVRILYAAQTGVEPPTFVFFTNVATSFHFSYERYLMNRLREAFGFVGSPLRLHVRRKAARQARKRA